jgi:hypothetical protein
MRNDQHLTAIIPPTPDALTELRDGQGYTPLLLPNATSHAACLRHDAACIEGMAATAIGADLDAIAAELGYPPRALGEPDADVRAKIFGCGP